MTMKKFFSCLFAYLIIGLLPLGSVYAQSSSGDTEPQQARQLYEQLQKSKAWMDGETYGITTYLNRTRDRLLTGLENTTTANLVYTTLAGETLLVGPCVEGQTGPIDIWQTDPQYCIEGTRGSALGGVNTLIYAMVVNPPANTDLALHDFGSSLGFLPKSALAQSQGIGFTGLTPLLPIWKGFRNIAYAILAVIMIIVGFMVMFRKKIDPKTVVTVQNALPGIVVTLLLITFSYAIAGFLIDMMYLLTAVGIAILGPAGYKIGAGFPGGGASVPTAGVQNFYLNSNDLLSGGFLALFTGVFGPLLNLANPFSGAFSVVASAVEKGFQAANFIPGLISGAFGVFSQAIIGPIMTIILAIAFIVAFVRIFFLLLTSYVQIIFAVIIGPLQILLGALPGGDGFGSWAKNLIINLLAFPITIIILIITNMLGSNMMNSQLDALWVPPLLPQPFGSGTNNATANFAYTVMWLGLIMSIPNIVGGIKEALKAKTPIPVGTGAIAGPIGAGAMQLMQLAYYGTSVASLFMKGKEKPSPFAELLTTILESQKDLAAKIAELKK